MYQKPVFIDKMDPGSEPKKNTIDYLLEKRERGRFLYSNFQAMKNVGISPYIKTAPIRQELGDQVHIATLALQVFSFLYLSPRSVYEFYRLGKILGYCTIDGLLKTLKMKSFVNALAKTGLLSMVFHNKRVQKALIDGWKNDGGGVLENIEADKKGKKLEYTLGESRCGIIKTIIDRYHYEPLAKSSMELEVGILSGQTEALFGGLWDGIETECVTKGDPCCKVEVCQHEGTTIPGGVVPLTKEEYNNVLYASIDLVVSEEKDTGREQVGDFLMIAIPQSINYLILSTSRGHVVLCKWAGRKIGERIIRKAKKNNLFDALDFIKKLFFDMKIGIIEYEITTESIMIHVRESVYSAGVKNINMKLCGFLSGIFEGCINEATKKKDSGSDESMWRVTETGCTANGDPCCEFECKSNDPEVLTKLLLG